MITHLSYMYYCLALFDSEWSSTGLVHITVEDTDYFVILCVFITVINTECSSSGIVCMDKLDSDCLYGGLVCIYNCCE